MAERLDIEDVFRENDTDLCQYAIIHFAKVGLRLVAPLVGENFQCKSSHYSLLDIRCLMTNHVSHPIRTCFNVTCSCVDVGNGTFYFKIAWNFEE